MCIKADKSGGISTSPGMAIMAVLWSCSYNNERFVR